MNMIVLLFCIKEYSKSQSMKYSRKTEDYHVQEQKKYQFGSNVLDV